MNEKEKQIPVQRYYEFLYGGTINPTTEAQLLLCKRTCWSRRLPITTYLSEKPEKNTKRIREQSTDLYIKKKQEIRWFAWYEGQGCGSVFIFYGSGSGSRAWWWRPIRIRIRIRIQYGSKALMTKNWKKITAENFLKFFFDQKLQFTYP